MVRDAAIAYTDEQQKLVFEADDAEVVAAEAALAVGAGIAGRAITQCWCCSVRHDTTRRIHVEMVQECGCDQNA